MPKSKTTQTMSFGTRLAQLRKDRGFTQQELADQIGLSRRMLAYYEAQSEHPPTTHLPAIAQALLITTDEILGLVPVKRQTRQKDSRLLRRMQEIEKLDAQDRRQVLQLLDAFIEKGQLKRKIQRAA